MSFKQSNEEMRISIIDLDDTSTKTTRIIEYQDVAGQIHQIAISTTFDGYTKTVRIFRRQDDHEMRDDAIGKESIKLSGIG